MTNALKKCLNEIQKIVMATKIIYANLMITMTVFMREFLKRKNQKYTYEIRLKSRDKALFEMLYGLRSGFCQRGLGEFSGGW
ncbi:hypothetical protein GCM10009122_15500 [Fulvivirga kasyanovii]